MIVNVKTGQIAYHAFLLQEDGPMQFVQYDYDDKPLDRFITADEKYIEPHDLANN